MIADLPRATEFGIAALEEKAALTSDCQALLAALPPMADILRYGEARAGTVEHLASLMPRIVVQAALALPYAARNLDAAAAGKLRGAILAADSAIQLAELEADVVAGWRDALQALLRDNQATRLVAGTAARLLYEVELLTAEQASDLLPRMLSPGTPVAEAAGFFEGFFEGAGQRLIHDAALRGAVDGWLMALDEEAFTANLPLFRRVFSALDPAERRRLMDALFERRGGGAKGYRLIAGRRRDLAEASGAGDRTPELRSGAMSETDERNRRWTLALGVDPDAESSFALSDSDRRMSDALTALYGDGDDAPKKGRGGLGGSAPRVAKWLGDIREFFPAPVVQVIQKDAFERKGLRQMLIEPEFLADRRGRRQPDRRPGLVARRDAGQDQGDRADRDRQGGQGADGAAGAAHADAIRGALNRSQRTNRPRFSDIDWPRTIKANLRHYQAEHSHRGARDGWSAFCASSGARRSRRGGAVRRPVGIDGDVGRLCLDLCGGHGVAAGRRDQAGLFRHRDRRPDRGTRRSRRGAVRRPARRRYRHQPGGRLLRRADRDGRQDASGADHRPL